MTETPARTEPLADFPVTRPSGCPFDPATGYADLLAGEQPAKVSTPLGVDVWVVSRYAEVREVLSDPRLSSRSAPSAHAVPEADLEREVESGSILQNDGARHAHLRRLLTSEFTVKRVQALRPRIVDLIEQHLDAMLASDGPVDLVEQFALPIPSLVICELLGVPYSDRDQFQRWSALLLAVNRTQQEMQATSEQLQEYMARLVMAKQAERTDDLLSRLITRAEDQGAPLTVPELVSIGNTLLIAGHETTANMIALSTLALLRNPEQLQQLRDNPELAPTAVEEMLRYLSVVQFGLFRHVLEDLPIGAETVKAGEYLVAALSAGNRDESVFPDPDRIDLTRKASTHLAFGFGPHQCLGQQLARVELAEVYTRLFRRIPTLRLAVPFEQLRFKHDALVYGVTALPVTWDRDGAEGERDRAEDAEAS
ncbi:cytochrome P450 [Kribbella flavida DSM 17836]|uniref:Cytochrome P450 n=1 Tax=Kribbella flavida (strain DSM 17836 / JCM 10339 / NBRC 14399) TaxID=479435 RepID=D2Q0Q7_KRIFD|nr:cytochrome P450 [Kribbella flavida]ADB33857.1 cytochrome P450 [Kribbella flavida DSM 17836]